MAEERAGLVNVYVCRECGGHTVTKNRDEGTTPFMISCRATSGCKGAASSSFYRVSQQQQPTILWIKPTPAELEAFIAAHADKGPHVEAEIRRHVSLGGLLDVDAPAPVASGFVFDGSSIGFDVADGPDTTVIRCRSCGVNVTTEAEARAHLASAHGPELLAALLGSFDEWLGNSEELMTDDIIDWREQLAIAIGAEPRT